MDSSPKLRACPFCGSPAAITSREGATLVEVACSNAGACPKWPKVAGLSKESAVNAWNRGDVTVSGPTRSARRRWVKI